MLFNFSHSFIERLTGLPFFLKSIKILPDLVIPYLAYTFFAPNEVNSFLYIFSNSIDTSLRFFFSFLKSDNILDTFSSILEYFDIFFSAIYIY